MANTEKFTLILDSSQLSTIYSCMQKWDWSQNHKLYKLSDEGGELPLSQAILGGTYGHKLMEVYDTVLMKTGDAVEAISIAGNEETWSIKEPQHFFTSGDKVETFLREISTLDPKRKSLVYQRAFGSIVRYARDPYTVLGVEQGFSHKLYEDDNNLFILEGRFDILIEKQGIRLWADHKFQDQARNLYPKNVQFRNYSMVSGCNTGMINYVRLNQSETPTTYHRALTPFSPDELEAWRNELILKYFEVKSFKLYGPPVNHTVKWRNRGTCGHFEYDECWYTQLCNETNPELIQIRIDQNYGIREKMWRPWE